MTYFINIHYCYDYLVNQISTGLLLYSHIPTGIIALLFGGFLLYKSRKLPSILLFAVCLVFGIWCLLDLGSWFAFLGSEVTMFTWSLTDLFTLLIFFLSYYFLHVFIKERDLPFWQKFVSVAILVPTIAWTFMGSNLLSFDTNTCEAIENEVVTNYPLYVQGFFLVASIAFAIYEYFKEKQKEKKRVIALVGLGVISFLFFFFFSLFLADLLVTLDIWQYAYNVEIYGLFGMPLLLIFLGYLIVRYKAFDLKIFGAQALVVSLIAVTGSELFFVTNVANRILVGITMLLAVIFGYFLIKSVKGEIKAKESLQIANARLKELDRQKTEFISFASHQLRSPLTSVLGNSSMLLEGDFGKLSPVQTDIVHTILASVKTQINVVEDYLNLSRIELGTMKYNLIDIDLKDMIRQIMNEQKPNIEAKGLTWTLDVPDALSYHIKADPDKFKQVLMNTIDNSVKYTPTGSIAVSVSKDEARKMIRVKISDTGVGIAPEVMPKLFQKFSRAATANEANIHGTGLGLFIAKDIMNAHGGKIWAESAGEGKGSQFYVEIPEAK